MTRAKAKKWRVTFKVERVKILERGARISTAKAAEARAREAVLFDDEMPLDREEIGDVIVQWVDKFDVGHTETCLGNHCGHYACADNDIDQRDFCTTCDPGTEDS